MATYSDFGSAAMLVSMSVPRWAILMESQNVGSPLGDIDGIADGLQLGRDDGNELGLEDGDDDGLAVGVTVVLCVMHFTSSRSSVMQALRFMLNIMPSPQSRRYVTNPSSQKSISLIYNPNDVVFHRSKPGKTDVPYLPSRESVKPGQHMEGWMHENYV